MGSVYLAFDTRLKRHVALKAPSLGPHDGPEARERFRRAAQAAAPLQHPHICGVLDAGEIDGVVYLTMAYVEGRTLAARLADGWRPAAGQAAALVRKLALALDYAHRKGVVHRDVKPSNVLLDGRGEPVLIDFGLARSLRRDSRLTRGRAVIGTPAYAAPEQVEQGASGPPGDLFSLGVVLYELLTGKSPFQRPGEDEVPNEAVLYARLLSPTPHPPPSAHRPDLDPRLEAVCLKAAAKDPAERYPDAAAFADALAPFVDDSFRIDCALAHAAPPVTLPPGDECWSMPPSHGGADAPPPGGRDNGSAAGTAAPARHSAAGWGSGVAAAVAAGLLTGAVAFLCLWSSPPAGPPVADPVKAGGPPPDPAKEYGLLPAPADPQPPLPPAETEAGPRLSLGTEAPEQPDYAGAAPTERDDAKALYCRGRGRTVRRAYDEAVADFTAALRLDDDCAEAYWGRAAARLARNDCDEAVRDATEALRRRPAFPQALVVRGLARYRQGMDDVAFADFAEALRLIQEDEALSQPVFARDHADRAAFYLLVDQYGKAAESARQAVRLDPNCAAGYLLLAAAYHDQGMRAQEVAAYSAGWNACRPADAADRVDRARLALGLDRPADTVAECDAAVRQDPTLAEAYAVRADAWRRRGERGQALADYARAAQRSRPRWARDYLDRASLHESAGKYDLAAADAGDALRRAPRLWAAWKQRGEAARKTGDETSARADYERAAALLTPKGAAGYFDRAWLYNELGEYEGAAADCRRALQAGLQSGAVQEELAYAYGKKKEYREAASCFDAALQLTPNDPGIYRYRGETYAAEGRYDEAVADFTRALALDPGDAAALDDRGGAYVKQGRYEEAAADYTGAITLDPGNPTHYRNRARAYAGQAGDESLRSALDDCSQALALIRGNDPAFLSDVFNVRGLLYERLGDYPKAVADFTEAVRRRPDDPVLYRNRAGAHRDAGDADASGADEKKAQELESGAP
jgi:tetratricopeptide (TPR) repeat protein